MSKSVRRCCTFFWTTERFRLGLLCLGLVLVAGTADGQEERKVPITFLPPPLENATYSLGIYTMPRFDKGAKRHYPARMIRQLCEEWPESAFTVGLNGLITSWDGKDDQGNPVPPGTYHAHGFAVGVIKTTGKEIIVDEWMQTDALPALRQVDAIAFVPEDEGLAVLASVKNHEGHELMRYAGADGHLLWHVPVPTHIAQGTGPYFPSGTLEYMSGTLVAKTNNAGTQVFAVADGKAFDPAGADRMLSGDFMRRFTLPRQSSGKDGTTWKIAADGVYQFSADGEPLRHLGLKPDEPVPVAVAASPQSDRLYLLECSSDWLSEAGGWQRVRGLSWVSAGQEEGRAVSDWQTVFERNIHHPDFNAIGPSVDSSVSVETVENPLSPGRNRRQELTVKMNAKGTYLAAGSLRLHQISQQVDLSQFFLRQDSPDRMSVLQVGGVRWGVFSVEGMKNIMEFDAGGIEMTAEGEKTHSEKPDEPPDL